jgi:hypothetical protein
MDPSAETEADRTPHVAVIAIHGVGDHEPGSVVRQVATLLGCLRHDGTGASSGSAPDAVYSVAETDAVTVTVTPVVTALDKRHAAPRARFKSDFIGEEQQRTEGRRSPRDAPGSTPGRGDTDEPPIDVRFTEDLLRGHTGSLDGDRGYTTPRIRMIRNAPLGAIRVSLYEMYWADLSRLKAGAWRILAELYTLLFHVCTLGRHAIEHAMVGNPGEPRWPRLHRAHAWVEALLAGPIAWGNLALAFLALMAIPVFLPQGWHALAGQTLVVAAFAPAMAWAFWCGKTHGRDRAVMLLLVILAVSLASAIGWWRLGPTRHAVLVLATVCAVGWCLVARAYEKRMPGFSRVASVIGVVLFGAFAMQVAGWVSGDEAAMSDREVVVRSGLAVGEAIFAILFAAWIALAVAQFAVAWTGFRLKAAGAPGTAGAVDTGRIGIMFSTGLFALLTLVLWAALVRFASPSLAGIAYTPWIPWPFTVSDATAVALIEGMLTASASTFTFLVVSLTLLVGAFTLTLAPSLAWEIAKPAADRHAGALGEWLSRGYERTGAVIGGIFVTGQIVLLLYLASVLHPDWLDAFSAASRSVIDSVGGLVAGSAVTLVALGSRFARTLGKLRVVLDVALDVDNHFREHPREANPRSRIFARYASLLREIVASGRYDGIVLVSHSQGTVITSDLLRYLGATGSDRLAGFTGTVPVYLFTCGSPLRQLYERSFPQLYRWVEAIEHAPGARGPDPASLGVRHWVNAYCSGDYVGRALWRGEAAAQVFSPGDTIEGRTPGAHWREVCVGAGAHTHYFDPDAERVGAEIDRLIRIAGLPGAQSR